MNHPELDFARYHNAPGYKRGGTSKAAADSMKKKAPSLEQEVLRVLSQYKFTADECAEYMRKSVLSIRPRLSALLAKRLIADTGLRRPNASNRMATVWRAV